MIAAICVAGCGITLWVFYPGIMNYDARYVYEDAQRGFYGDWQSPVMTLLWALIDPIDPGPGSIFLVIVGLYWLAFAVLALTMLRRSLWLAVALPILALSPPAIFFAGIIWRDVLFASTWLCAAAFTFAVADRGAHVRVPVQIAAAGLLSLGVLLRPNALLAAPILAAYIAWPAQFSWKRTAMLYLPAAALLFGLVQAVYYGVLGATRQHPLHSVMVFDLGGITHFSKSNQFPIGWTPEQTAMLTDGCYEPTEWNIYWTREPCRFVMDRLEAEKVFGSPALVSAWTSAIANHPLPYLRHRAAFTWTFLAGDNLTMWIIDLDDPSKIIFAGNAALMWLKAMHDLLVGTPLLRVGPWLLLCVVLAALGWRRRATSAGAFVVGVCGSAAVYVLSFAIVGVAPEFRYGYWAVLAGLAGAVVSWPQRIGARRPHAAASLQRP